MSKLPSQGSIIRKVTKKGELRCSACGHASSGEYSNPLLLVPLCEYCHDNYTNGEFTTDSTNEIYCRWCGEGEGELMLCDTCPKSFCSRCIRNNFGEVELRRIMNLPDRWSCYICSPQALRDLMIKNGWNKGDSSLSSNKKRRTEQGKINDMNRPGLICYDVSRGREKFEIPVINTVDDAPPPLDFVYITSPVAGEGIKLTNNPNYLTCCSCTDNCSTMNCECVRASNGPSYDLNGKLINDKPSGIYECNPLCGCHMSACKNRVVGLSPQQKLEVFRCENTGKGWGVRCRSDLPSGTYIADYIGEVMPDMLGEIRGLTLSDEYLFTMDCWGRSNACQRLHDLGMKQSLSKTPKELFIDSTAMDENDLSQLFDENFVNLLKSKGAIQRAQQKAALINNDNISTTSANDVEVSINQSSKANNKSNKSINKIKEKGSTKHERSWINERLEARDNLWTEAKSIIVDRCIVETEESGGHYVIDARWYGSVARFLNHSCAPNLDKLMVFCDSQDVRTPRIAFFTNDFIAAGTELCYDYGYYEGNVDGKHKPCLCGAEMCRKTWY